MKLSSWFRQFLITMLLLIVNLQLTAHNNLLQNKPLSDILDQISEHYEIIIAYNARILSKVEVRFEIKPEETFEHAVNRALISTRFKYKQLTEKYYIVYEENTNSDREVKKIQRKFKQIQKLQDKKNITVRQGGSNKKLRLKSIVADLEEKLSQEKIISGSVKDREGTPLIGATVLVKGSTEGTTTDFDGNFQLSVADDVNILVFSYTGYESQEVTLDGRLELEITLFESISQLGEVVVIGYGVQRKKDLTGSVSRVGGSDLENIPASRVDNILQGRASGVQVSQISGEPGAATTIRIRGGNSIQGNNEPLWVIDGVIVGTDYNLNNLNTNDIESIDILKDAVAVSIYGTRGANGVILVTTKSGSGAEGTNVSFNIYRGQQSLVTQVDFLNGQEHAIYANEDAEFRNSALPFPDLNQVPDVDWIDQVTGSAPVLNVDASVSGTSNNGNVNFYVSGNYFNQDGIIRASGIEKYIFRANMDIKLSDLFKVGFRANLSNIRQENPKINIDGLYLSTTPTRAIFEADGSFTALDPITDGISRNFEADIQLRDNHNQITNLLGNVYVEFTPIENMVFRSTISPEINDFKQNIFNPGALPNNAIIQNGGNARVNNSLRKGWINENTLSYNVKVRNNDNLTLLAGFTVQQSQFESSFSRSDGLSNDVTGYNNLAFGADPTRNQLGSSFNSFQLISYLGRINYSLDDRFLFTLVGRVDGSSRFAPDNKYSFFPSGAVAWRLIEEDFIKEMDLFSNLKLRASFGLSGSQAIDSYRTLAVLNTANTTFGNTIRSGVILGRPENPDLQWETTRQLDIGLEMGFFNNRLAIELDYYQKTTEDLLLNAQLPRQTGFVSKLQNLGKVENKGLELLINSTNITNKDFSWSTIITVSGNRNKVVDLGGVDFINLVTPAQQGGTGARLIVGEPVPVFTGVNYLGTWKSQEEIDAVGLGGNHDVGGPRFEDTNGDGEVNEEDFIVLGNPQPDFYFGIGNTITYKNFELDFFFQGTQGNEVFNSLSQTALFGRPETTKYRETLDRWSPDNPDSDIPRAGAVASLSEIYNNSFMIEDGSHIRLKSLRLGYTIPGSAIGLNGVRGINVYISGSNLFVISDFRLKDPETSQFSRDSDNLSFGFSRGQYPSTRIVSLGARVDF